VGTRCVASARSRSVEEPGGFLVTAVREQNVAGKRTGSNQIGYCILPFIRLQSVVALAVKGVNAE